MLGRSGVVALIWVALTGVVLLTAPDLSQMAAESFGSLLPDDAETVVAREIVRRTWPDRSQGSAVAVVMHRPAGLTDADREYARQLARAMESAREELSELARRRPPLRLRRSASDDPARPPEHGGLTRVLGPESDPEIARRLVSADKTTQLVIAGLAADWVAPQADRDVQILQEKAAKLTVPEGLEVTWSGDAALGSAYMSAVRTTLDRAALLVVVLLLIILLIVYRSLILALVPLMTIGMSLLIARGLLAWMAILLDMDPNPLVELFLIAVLFGTGTDLVLLLTWRFSEHWDGTSDPKGALAETLCHERIAMISSAGTLILALALLGFSRFKLFNQTGPFVAVGMLVGLIASLTLAPSLLLLLARNRPHTFKGFRRPSSDFWPSIARHAMRRPLLGWTLGVVLLGIPALHALRVETTYDMIGDLPEDMPALHGLRMIVEKFGPGEVSPITIVIQGPEDWRDSKGLALIDEISQSIDGHDAFGEVRSATQPLGSRELLKDARIDSRLAAIRAGLEKIRSGADLMARSFAEEAAKIRILLGVSRFTGLRIPGFGGDSGAAARPEGAAERAQGEDAVEARQGQAMLEKLGQAAEGARMIAEGTALASKELGVVLDDPADVDPLDRILLTRENIAEHPELQRAFEEYISPDGKTTRIEVGMTARMHSREALDQSAELLDRVADWNYDHRHLGLKGWITGPNLVMAQVRQVTNEDMMVAYVLLPLGILLALVLLLRDFGICLNLVLTMLLTYWSTIGITDVLFSTVAGTEGLDWKVKFFAFVILMACGVDYNIFLVSRMRREVQRHGLREGIVQAIGHTGALITSAAAITICSYLAFLASPLDSLRGLGFAVGLGIAIDALLVRTVIMPAGHYLMFHRYEELGKGLLAEDTSCDNLGGT